MKIDRRFKSELLIENDLIKIPKNWDVQIWKKMLRKNRRDRLIIVGALVAAEIDRMDAVHYMKGSELIEKALN